MISILGLSSVSKLCKPISFISRAWYGRQMPNYPKRRKVVKIIGTAVIYSQIWLSKWVQYGRHVGCGSHNGISFLYFIIAKWATWIPSRAPNNRSTIFLQEPEHNFKCQVSHEIDQGDCLIFRWCSVLQKILTSRVLSQDTTHSQTHTRNSETLIASETGYWEVLISPPPPC